MKRSSAKPWPSRAERTKRNVGGGAEGNWVHSWTSSRCGREERGKRSARECETRLSTLHLLPRFLDEPYFRLNCAKFQRNCVKNFSYILCIGEIVKQRATVWLNIILWTRILSPTFGAKFKLIRYTVDYGNTYTRNHIDPLTHCTNIFNNPLLGTIFIRNTVNINSSIKLFIVRQKIGKCTAKCTVSILTTA